MTTERAKRVHEKGIALVYVGVFLVPLLLCTGLAVDLGRGYLVRVALSKAVDAAALAAARSLNGNTSVAGDVAKNIFNANFPAGFLGVSALQNPPDISFTLDAKNGANIIRVSSTATIPTTFMRIARFENLTVAASAEATRRLVDMSFVIDRSGSLGSDFPNVKSAAKAFIENNFSPDNDRIALITFSSGTKVVDRMSATRGFQKSTLQDHIDAASLGGPTATAEALYRAWDELRSVPKESQSGLRIVVLFTDGSPNAFPGKFPKVALTKSVCDTPFTSTTTRLSSALEGTLCAVDYQPGTNGAGAGKTTFYPPWTVGLYKTEGTDVIGVDPTHVPMANANLSSLDYVFPSPPDINAVNKCIPFLPVTSFHSPPYHSILPIPTQFNLFASGQRAVGSLTADGYPNTPPSAYNAARNLAETIANEIRNDKSGAGPIRIYTLGLGPLLTVPLGQYLETGSSILQHIANDPDPSNIQHNSSQPEGAYYFAGNSQQLEEAFQAVADQIVRLTQ